MSDAELAKNDPAISVSQATSSKRSRTGCLTCRTRRRKCDENRPICANCTDKKLECRYPALFQFLGKNSYTLEGGDGGRFANIQFASDTGENTVVGAIRNEQIVPVVQDAAVVHVSSASANPIQERDTEHRPRSLELQDVASYTPSPNSYEFALHGLMALSSTSTEHEAAMVVTADEHHLPDTDLSRSTDFTLSSVPFGNESPFDNNSTHHAWQVRGESLSKTPHIPDNGTAVAGYAISPMQGVGQYRFNSFSGRERASHGQDAYSPSLANSTWSAGSGATRAEEELNLLRVYRYQIAPWLDMCASHQTFGVMVPLLSTKSDLIRESILKLAKTVQTEYRAATSQVETDNAIERDSGQDAAQGAILGVLRLAEGVFWDLNRFWEAEEIDQQGRRLLEALVPKLHDDSLLATSAYWLALRLGNLPLIVGNGDIDIETELSCAIIATHPIQLPLPFLASSALQTAADHDIARHDIAIALCCEAVMFSHEDDSRRLQQRYGLRNRVDVWNTLIHAFGAWFKTRPLEYQPLIELYSKDGIESEHDFPIIAFTSGAALLANALYHLGMLLLLQNKPRIHGRSGSNSSAMSKLWHSHRVCGLAIQNDQPTIWDPTLIASLIVAARTLTHRDQQAIIIQTLQNAQRLTKWNISRSIEDLTSEWRLADGW